MASDTADAGTAPPGLHEHSVTFRVDGTERHCTVDAGTTVLDVLRDRLGVTSPKKGCDLGQCGSCTVLLDGRRRVTCLALAVAHDGAEIVTAAGLAADGPHPLQERFLERDAFQCGYCTPGQICRCAAYPNIVDAIREVAGQDVAGPDVAGQGAIE
jgi:xanthine dehydrogenase YagT iron-sulfur-binding subunit